MEREIEQETDLEIKQIELQFDEEKYAEIYRKIKEEKRAIDEIYHKKMRQKEMETAVLISRYKFIKKKELLEAMSRHVADITAMARLRLLQTNLPRFARIYRKILGALLLQGLVRLVEARVSVRFRRGDLEAVWGAGKAASAAYLQATGRPVELLLDLEAFLPDASLGGLVLYTPTVCIVNTLDARLRRLVHAHKPLLRRLLFTTEQLVQ